MGSRGTWWPVAVAAVAVALFLSGCGDAGGAPSKPKSERTAGEWRTWVLPSGSSIRVPPPPEKGSEAARKDAAQLRSAVSSRDAREEKKARTLEREPAVEPWLRDVLGFVAARPSGGLTQLRAG